MTLGTSEVEALLERARRRERRVNLATAACGGAAAALAAILAGAAAEARWGTTTGGVLPGSGAGEAIRWLALGVGAAGLLGAAAWAAASWRRSAGSAAALARKLAPSPALRSDLLSAVELGRARAALEASGAASVELVDAHRARTAGAVAGLDLAAAIPARPARRAAAALGGVALLLAAALVAGGAPVRRALGRLLAGSPPAPLSAGAEPITGEIEVTYRYPAYLHLGPRTVAGTDGSLRAPPGTEALLRTRSDRPVEAAELEIDLPDRNRPPAPGAAGAGAAAGGARPGTPAARRVALAVSGGREISGGLVVAAPGSYRFRFTTARGRPVAEGPPIPIAVEPDAFPTVRIVSPAADVEVAADAVVRLAWEAEDDHGLAALDLVTRGPGGVERRRPVRALAGLRRDAGTVDLPLAAERLGEGDRLRCWLEVRDDDAVSGPKTGSSRTLTVKVYSEAEHRRAAMDRARAAWEALVALLADRLELGAAAAPGRPARAAALDRRARAVAVELRDAAATVRREQAAPREVAIALSNVAAELRAAAEQAAAFREGVARRAPPVPGPQLAAADARLDAGLERGVLYLEALFDKVRGEELVRLAREVSARRRDLQAALERFRDAPSAAARGAALGELRRLRGRIEGLLARMAAAARGFHDEHMNAEAVADLSRRGDLLAGVDAAERALARGDAAGALKAVDALADQVDRLAAGLARTARLPDARQRELMKDLLAFKGELAAVEESERALAGEAGAVRDGARRRLEPRLQAARAAARRLVEEAVRARRGLEAARPGVPLRVELDDEIARDALTQLERALAIGDLDAALAAARRALSPASRLEQALEEDVELARRLPGLGGRDPAALRAARRSVAEAVPRIALLRDALARDRPELRTALTPAEAQRLGRLAAEQGRIERRAAELQARLGALSRRAPVFPPRSAGLLGDARGHMDAAASQLGTHDPQRGVGEQEAALESLRRLSAGLDQAARGGQGSGDAGGGSGFPFPFAIAGGAEGDGGDGDGGEGDGGEEGALAGDEGRGLGREEVAIPGAEAHRLPEAFRRALLDAMKQGAPARYRGEVQRYYEEIVR